MEKMSAASDLQPIEADDEMEVSNALFLLKLHLEWIHLRVVPLYVESTERRTGRRPDQPHGFSLHNQATGFTTMLWEIKVPWSSIVHAGTKVQGVQAVDIESPSGAICSIKDGPPPAHIHQHSHPERGRGLSLPNVRFLITSA